MGEITIGAYTIGPGYREDDTQSVTIFCHETGEGGEFSIAELEEWIAQFYKENL